MTSRLERLVESRRDLHEFWSGPKPKPASVDVLARGKTLYFVFEFGLPTYKTADMPSMYFKNLAYLATGSEDVAKDAAEYAAIEAFRATRESGWDGPVRREFTRRAVDLNSRKISLTYVMEYDSAISPEELKAVNTELKAYF